MLPRTSNPLQTRTILLLVLGLALIWFLPLGIRHLVPNDEGRYAEMAREMFVTGDWITPRYNGYKYFEKPPLETWANALTFALFGIGDWQARLYTALTGFAGVLVLTYTVSRVFDALTGLYAGVILATAPYWNLMGHFNTLDMGLSFWMELTLCALLLAHRATTSESMRLRWMALSWAAMAMAVLSKGLVGVILPGAVLVIYTFLARDWALWRRMSFRVGIPVFLLIAAPWFVLVQIKNPDFFHFFFVVQQFQRYLTPDQHRPGPLFYFIPVILLGFLPWLGLLPSSIRAGRAHKKESNGFAPVILLAVWSIFIFVFFSASHSKLLSYTLPIAPAIAVLLALGLSTLTLVQWRRQLIGYAVLLIIAGLGASYMGHLSSRGTPKALYQAYQIWVYLAVIVALILTLLAIRWNCHDKKVSVLTFGCAWLMFGTIAGNGHEVMGRELAGVALVPAVKAAMAQMPPDTPFYSVTKLDHTMPFYLGHTMIMVQGADELQFGVDAEPQKWIPTIDAWIQRWDQERYGLALMGADRYQALLAMHVPMRIVAQDARRVIVEKPFD